MFAWLLENTHHKLACRVGPGLHTDYTPVLSPNDCLRCPCRDRTVNSASSQTDTVNRTCHTYLCGRPYPDSCSQGTTWVSFLVLVAE